MKCTFISLAVLVTAILLIFLAPATCGIRASEDDFEWPRWRGPNGDGISKEKDWNPKALTGGPKIL